LTFTLITYSIFFKKMLFLVNNYDHIFHLSLSTTGFEKYGNIDHTLITGLSDKKSLPILKVKKIINNLKDYLPLFIINMLISIRNLQNSTKLRQALSLFILKYLASIYFGNATYNRFLHYPSL